jgi:hypothetical protein
VLVFNVPRADVREPTCRLSTIYNDQRYEAPSQYEALSNIYADQTYVASTTRPAAPATPAVDGMERFQVTLLPSDTSEPESVFLQVRVRTSP